MNNIDPNKLYWEGLVVPKEQFKGNRPDELFVSQSQVEGRGYRVPVRIYNKHPNSKNVLPDSDLEWIEVSGSLFGNGSGALGATPGITQGTEVFGIYRDFNGGHPIILGVKLINANTKLHFTSDSDGFKRLSGFSDQDDISGFCIPVRNEDLLENTIVTNPNQASQSDNRKLNEDRLSIRSICDKGDLNGIRLQIQNLIKKIEKVKSRTKSWENALNNPISYEGKQISVSQYIDLQVKNASKAISSFVKDKIINPIRKFIIEKIGDTIKKFYYLIFPNKRTILKDKAVKAIDSVSCLFNKIVKNLFGMISNILYKVIDRYINVPLCAVENIMGSFLGNILGFVTSSVETILEPIKAITGAFSLTGDILGFTQQLLGFFACEEQPECPDVNEWDIWGGASPTEKFDVNAIFEKAKLTSSNIKNSTNFNFDNKFEILTDSCNVGPVFCGPPIVKFYGGGGSGATGNAIVSATGDILGVDIISSGSGYTKEPIVKFIDNCGKGKGAVGRAVIGPVKTNTTDTGSTSAFTNGITDVIIENTGSNYLPSYDGSLGGDGRVVIDQNEIIIQRSDGTYEIPNSINDPYELNEGDIQIGPYTKNNIPKTALPTNSRGQYPIFLKICNVEITSPGINYKQDDKITIEPNNGALLNPIFGPYGTLDRIDIIEGGSGFEEMPNIYINSETGYGAKIIPILCVNKINNDTEEMSNEMLQDLMKNKKIINVVDCVGKI